MSKRTIIIISVMFLRKPISTPLANHFISPIKCPRISVDSENASNLLRSAPRPLRSIFLRPPPPRLQANNILPRIMGFIHARAYARTNSFTTTKNAAIQKIAQRNARVKVIIILITLKVCVKPCLNSYNKLTW